MGMRDSSELCRRLALWVSCVLMTAVAPAYGETYWLDSRYDHSQTHYPNGEEACLTGELQRRTDDYRATSSLPHRFTSAYVGPDYGGERICRGQIQRRQFNMWLPVELVDTPVYGALGSAPPCALSGLIDPETGQCGIPKCDGDCPTDGGNGSNPIASATGNKRQRELDYIGGGVFPLEFVRYYNSHRVPDNQTLPIGVGWTHSYAARVVPMLDGSTITRIRAYRPNGAIQTFTLIGSNWVPDSDVPEQLTATVSGGALVSASYVRADDTSEVYDEFGRLTTVTSPEGFIQTLSYASGSGTSSQVQRVTDPHGRWLDFSYSAGALTSLTDSAGTTVGFTHSGGNLISATYPDEGFGVVTRTYHYNEAGQTGGISQPHVLTGITDENGNRYVSWGYDADRRAVLSVQGPYATGTADRVTFQFNAGGTSTITDSLGKARTYNFDVSHRAARLSSLDAPCDGCANAAASRTYDANGYPASETDFDGNVTSYTYSSRGLETERIEAVTDTAGNRRTIQTDWHSTLSRPIERRVYDATNDLIALETFTHNSRGQVLSHTQTDPVTLVDRAVSTAYCEPASVGTGTCPLVGLRTSFDGPRADVSDITAYAYYQTDHSGCASSPISCQFRKGDLHKVTNALGQETEFLRYDATGRPISVTDPNGVVSDYEYHPRGWLMAVKIRGPNNAVETDDRITRIAYWPTGLVRRITQPDSAFLEFSYDGAQRLVRITDNEGSYISYTLDAAGNHVAEQTRDSSSTVRRSLSRVYDLLGRLETVADSSNNPTDYVRDGNGNPITVTDPLNRVTSHQYDALNRLERTVQDVAGIAAETKISYDALNRAVKVTDPKGLETHYIYNSLEDLLELDSPDAGITTYSYDSGGNRSSQLDARGQVVEYSYDILNRPTAVNYLGSPALNSTYEYDTVPASCGVGESFGIGRLSSVTDGSGSTHYCYDRFGQVAQKIQVTNGQTFVVRYAYTLRGELAAVTYPDGTVADYVRDSQGRIAQIGVTGPGESREVLLTGASYHPFGAPAGWTYGNGRSLIRSYDLDYRATSIYGAGPDGLDVGFSYDPAGNLTGLHNPANAALPEAILDYDTLNRLTEFRDGPTGTSIESYTYDVAGSRTSFTSSAGTQAYVVSPSSNRLTSVASVARSYDAAGNTTGIGGFAKQFVYDATNRLSEVKVGGLTTRQYAHNSSGERVRSSSGASHVYSVYGESGQWLGDYDESGAAIQQVIWLDDAPVGVLQGAASVVGRLHYVEPDHMGTPRVVIEPTRNVAVWTWSLKGEAFGSSPPNEDPDGDSTTFTFNMRFPGQRYDAASGLNYNYFRDYDSVTGGYAQSDPIGLLGGSNTYAYVLGQPTQLYDKYGLSPAVVGGAVVMGAVMGCAGGCIGAVVGDFASCVVKNRAAGGKTLGQCSDECTPNPCDAAKSCISGCIAGAIIGGATAGRGVAVTPIAGFMLRKYFRFLFSPEFCEKYGIPTPPNPQPLPLPDWLRDL